MTHWYIADTHFGDDGIRAFFGRPFVNSGGMDREMVERIAARVNADDDLWVVGDFAASETAARIFDTLPGRIHLVRGNHDPEEVLRLPWASVHDLVEVQDDGQRFVLCHYPLLTWNGVRDGAINLFGHVHDRWRGTDNQVNVGVDLWDFSPVSRDEILRRAVCLPENLAWRAVEGEAPD